MSSASSDNKNMKEQQQTVITIRKRKITRDNLSLSSVSLLGESIRLYHRIDNVPQGRRGERNFQKLQSQGIK